MGLCKLGSNGGNSKALIYFYPSSITSSTNNLLISALMRKEADKLNRDSKNPTFECGTKAIQNPGKAH